MSAIRNAAPFVPETLEVSAVREYNWAKNQQTPVLARVGIHLNKQVTEIRHELAYLNPLSEERFEKVIRTIRGKVKQMSLGELNFKQKLDVLAENAAQAHQQIKRDKKLVESLNKSLKKDEAELKRLQKELPILTQKRGQEKDKRLKKNTLNLFELQQKGRRKIADEEEEFPQVREKPKTKLDKMEYQLDDMKTRIAELKESIQNTKTALKKPLHDLVMHKQSLIGSLDRLKILQKACKKTEFEDYKSLGKMETALKKIDKDLRYLMEYKGWEGYKVHDAVKKWEAFESYSGFMSGKKEYAASELVPVATSLQSVINSQNIDDVTRTVAFDLYHQIVQRLAKYQLDEHTELSRWTPTEYIPK